ncbi:MAG TPA: serine/threonine-protein kinase [Kofleriaceae bacterium]|nr:serine/threonine-protein kinase [Kofleriaceae bacterium]
MRKPIPFGKYYLLERINVGGMAEVFRAKAFGVEGFERLVAVKRILPNIAEDKDFIRMFIDEAKIAVQLNHANIAQIFDLGVVDTDYYIALEHIHGRDLRAIFDRCRQRPGGKGPEGTSGEPMPIAQACFIIMKVCEGLDYAHNKRDPTGRELNLVHRDVSPQNLIVSFEGEVKLIDFGIAKAAGKGSKTQAGILKGKFGYMSPEQVRGLPIDRRSDVFSCGIVLYELLTGERLFVGESDFSTLEKVRNVEILPPSTYNRRIPDELERIVLKALAKDAEERYHNAIDLHDELQAFVYTAGEFYSRKDLAGWMKTTFAAEIEEESAKLESFRHMTPPESVAPSVTGRPRTVPPAAPPVRRTLSMPVVPPPGGAGQGVHASQPQPQPVQQLVPPPNGRRSATMAAQAAAAAAAAASGPAASGPRMPAVGAQEPLEWDDDELETAIYTDKEELKAGRARSEAGMPAAAAAVAEAAAGQADSGFAPGRRPTRSAAQPVQQPEGSDVASPARTARSWPPPNSIAPRARNGGHPGSAFADGSSSPVPEVEAEEAAAPDTEPTPYGQAPVVEDPSAVVELAALARSRAQPMYGAATAEPLSFGSSFLDAHRHGRSRLAGVFEIGHHIRRSTLLQVAVTAAVGISIAVAVYLVTSRGGSSSRRANPSATAAAGSSGDGSPGAGSTAPAAGTAAAGTTAAGAAVAGTPGSASTAPPAGSAAAPPAGATASPPAAAGTAPAAASGPAPGTVSVDPASGFDLIVDPAGVVVKLDGRPIGKAPLQIRNLVEGDHLVELEGPAGFFNKSQAVRVARGQAQRVVVKLDAMQVVGKFSSEPSGARVTLMVDGEKRALGATPVAVVLDPRKRYEAVFRRDGYEPATRAVAMTGGSEIAVAAVLERSGGGRPAPSGQAPAAAPERKPKPAAAPQPDGALGLMAKPPCRIFIDGRDTGLKTPQVGMPLAPGRHKVTLINDEFALKESFFVEIQPGETMKAIKDLTGQLPAPSPTGE